MAKVFNSATLRLTTINHLDQSLKNEIMRLLILTFFCAFTSILSGQAPAPVLSLLFNGSADDTSTHMNHGSEMGSVAYTEDRFGNKCGALQLNGQDSYIEVPATQSLNGIISQFTITVWFKSNLAPKDFQWFTIACKGDDTSESTNSPQWRLQGTSKTISINTECTEFISQPVQAGKWYHYAVSWDGSKLHTYLNGVETGQFAYAGTLVSNNSPVLIGRDIPGNEEYFKGEIDELHIFDINLSDKEVASLYQDTSEKTSIKPCGQDSIMSPPVTPTIDTSQGMAPKVSFINPSKHHIDVTDRNFEAIAQIEGIQSVNDITVSVNGSALKQIDFNGNLVTIPLDDSSPVNTIKIEAKNRFGDDSDIAVVQYVSTNLPPEIQLSESTQLIEVNSEDYALSCNVKYTSQPNIKVLHNGKEKIFSYDGNTEALSSNIKLIPGINLIQIQASNTDGSDNRFIQLQYTEPRVQHDMGIVDTVQHIALPVGNITLSCYDHNKIDGDIVTIFLNDDILFEKLKLRPRSEKKAIKKLNLIQGKKYVLVCKAINEGTIATNTLSVRIEDDKAFSKVFKLQSKKGSSQAFSFVYN